MNATATHDTKRGEDVRARLNVLSELPEEWSQHLRNWHALTAPLKDKTDEGMAVPDPNAEYFLYQTLLGAFPFDDTDYPKFIDRVKEYMIKASREAKVYTSWQRAETDYEDALLNFIERLLSDPKNSLFLQEFQPFQRKIQHYGLFNSLSQTLLKITAPGVPDFYQGAELWDLSLVDPDNRRPIDYETRITYLSELQQGIAKDLPALISELLNHPNDGRIKLFLVYQALQARRAHADLFQRGTYENLTIVGSLKSHIISFTRSLGDTQIIVVAPRFLTSLIKDNELPLGEQVWHETRILPPSGTSGLWQDAISGQTIEGEETLWLKDILSQFPVALLVGQTA
jgi:(1->4)-alpha-D-glucan 1-alpha-D-glucosylmutase